MKDQNQNWDSGMFILRLKVQRGNKNDLYSFKRDDGEEFIAFRTENEVLCQKIGQSILEVYRQRLLSDEYDQNSSLNHPGPCRPVELGKQVFEKESVYINPWDKKNSSNYNNYNSNSNNNYNGRLYIS
jgi:hypothetical protein